MGERKVLNKYFPPDFDPAALPRGKRAQNNEKKVRMMLPMSVRCSTCGNFMYKGTKFNTRMEDVAGETYLGLKIFRFYYRCPNCAAEFCMKTDPQSTDYVLEAGATRNYEPWRDKEVEKKEAAQQREEEEMGNAMKALENRTLDSKREMDIMAALDEMQSLNARHNKVSTEDALAALQREAAKSTVVADQAAQQQDDADLAEFYRLKLAHAEQQAAFDELSTASTSDDDDTVRQAAKRRAGPGDGAAATASTELERLPDKDEAAAGPRGSASAPASAKPTPKMPVFKAKVVAKPKPKPAPPPPAAPKADDDGGALGGLLGAYGSSGSGSD